MLTNLFIHFGWSRDDLKWFWLQLVSVCGLIASNVLDVKYWLAYLGIPISEHGLHWVLGGAAAVLWVAGRYKASPLPSETAMKSGAVEGSPAAKLGAILLACVLAGAAVTTMACGNTIHTNVSPVADIANAGGKIEETGHTIFTTVVNAHNALPDRVPQSAEDAVAIAINKLGHVGLDLNMALGAYNAVKTAGGDLTAQRVAVQQILKTIENAMTDVGKALPPGTLQTIDSLVAVVLKTVAQVKLGVGL